jgi:hypothetical protein
VWYTAVVPLPLALPDLFARVKSGYYRQFQGIEHDARTIASNATLYNGPGSEVAALADGVRSIHSVPCQSSAGHPDLPVAQSSLSPLERLAVDIFVGTSFGGCGFVGAPTW